MKRIRVGVARLAAGFALVLAVLAATAAAASATVEPHSALTIHNRICPVEYNGNDLFGDCHDNPQTSNLEFSIDGATPGSGATDANGNITFSELKPGPYNISGGVPGEFASTQVYCSIDYDPDTVIAVTPTATGVSIVLPENNSVTCDWYNIPFDLRGDVGDDDDDDDTTGVTTLPSTGAGGTATEATDGWLIAGAAFLAMCGLAVVSRRRAFKL